MSVSGRLYKHSARLPKRQPLAWTVFFREVLWKDTVLRIAAGLALVAALAVRPPAAVYAESIDLKTLACLAALMLASGGMILGGVFDYAAARLVNACSDSRSLMTAMVAGTFLSSMFVTNDVALIVLVPMTLSAYRCAGCDPMRAVVLQTVAANVGSILLPMGNPQNLYLFSRYHMAFWPFFSTVLPLSLAGLALLAVLCRLSRPEPIARVAVPPMDIRPRDAAVYLAVFALAALAVFNLADYRIAVAFAAVVAAVKGKNLLQQVDYALLLTFVGFFVFVGAVSHIPAVEAALSELVSPRPYLAAAASSQVISNVPAAVLLSRFTDNGLAVLAGVSAGGCGTLIASMASLISYKLYVRSGGGKRRFLLYFTAINVLFLAAMTAAYLLFPPS